MKIAEKECEASFRAEQGFFRAVDIQYQSPWKVTAECEYCFQKKKLIYKKVYVVNLHFTGDPKIDKYVTENRQKILSRIRLSQKFADESLAKKDTKERRFVARRMRELEQMFARHCDGELTKHYWSWWAWNIRDDGICPPPCKEWFYDDFSDRPPLKVN